MQNDTIGSDDKSFRDAVNTKVQAENAVGIEQCVPIGIASFFQPVQTVAARIFVIQADDWNSLSGQLQQHRVFVAAGDAPGGPDVQQVWFIESGSLGRSPWRLQKLKVECRKRFADQGRRDFSRIALQTDCE